METTAYLLEQATKCRRLAARADDVHASEVLIALAEEYERLVATQVEDASRIGSGTAARA
jgi:hypothetical protein